MASNSHFNYIKWVDEGESKIEVNVETKMEENEVCFEKEKVVLDLMKKDEKLKRKLQQKRKVEKIMLLLFVVSWTLTIFFFVMFLLMINCNQYCNIAQCKVI